MKIKVTNENTIELQTNEVFVFGSNLAGIHEAGAAKLAKDKFKAEVGVGEGFTGKCYALPTKDENIETLSLNDIHKSIEVLYDVVKNNYDKFFIITAVGCGLAGYKASDVAPMFEPFIHLRNISLPQSFIDFLFPEKIIGYKVTDSNMKCRNYQFNMNGVHEVIGDVVICKNGFHFCKNLIDCFNYYDFDPNNRVFIVEGYGDYDFENNKVATRGLRIIKELSWYDVLKEVNTGFGNSGKGNSGNRNSGHYNSGNRNSGDYNSGDYNSGDYNSGHYNSGNRNSGDYNSGDYNSGHYNSGNRNSGDYNSGDYNSGDCNSGYYNSNTPTVRMFNKDTGLSFEEIRIPFLDIRTTVWVDEDSMTTVEKQENPHFYVTKGYLKTIPYKEAFKHAWGTNKTFQQEVVKLPNFDKDIFFEITGVKLCN